MEIILNRQNQAVHLEAINESGNTVQIDGPPSMGGESKGVRPMELLIMGLGGCSSMDLISILTKQKVVLDDYSVKIKADTDSENVPSLFTNIHVEFEFKGTDLNEKKIKRAVDLSMDKYCSVTKIMEKSAEITYTININNELVD